MDLLGRARTFVRVVEAGSLSAAARALGSSLAAVSRQISSLEAELGAPLLARTARTLRLTEEGRRFHEHAVRLTIEADAARASVQRDHAASGEVTVSASVSLGLLRIVPALPALLAAHPGLRCSVRLEERAVDLVGDGVDIAVRGGLAPPDTMGVVSQPVATYRRLIVGSPEYLREHAAPRSVAALAGHAAIVGLRAGARWEVVEEGERRAVEVQARVRVETMLGIREAAVAGLGLALLPEFVVAEPLAKGALRVVLPEVEADPVTVHALYRVEAKMSPSVGAVVGHLRATMPLAATAKDARPRKHA
jgi:DNA-binding transcriptional LysR family regulator